MISRARLQALLLEHVAERNAPVVSAADPHLPESVGCAGAFGRVLAAFHLATDDFVAPAGAEWTSPSRHALLGADPSWIERLYAHDADAAAALVAWWQRAHEVLADHVGSADRGMCHGEAHPATCRFVGDDELAVAELDWAGVGDRRYDLATYRWALELHAGPPAADLFARFLDGYGSSRAVPDLAPLRAWVAARHLWSLRLVAGFAEPAGLARRAAFAATWDVDG